jgi:phenylacetate-CoA ligase
MMDSTLPLYRRSFDWERYCIDYPMPDVFERTVYRWSPEQLRTLQNERFMKCMEQGWKNSFYSERWRVSGLEPGDVRSLDDISKLPTFNSDDIKASIDADPPFGAFHGIDDGVLGTLPLKLQSSGGTTGTPRGTLSDPIAWETQALTTARAMWVEGARPGDVMQIPMTCSLANAPWQNYKACHDFLGILPLTTGSGIVTSSRQQLEIAFRYGTNIWVSFPEYLTRLAEVCRDELKRDPREMKTKLLRTYLGPDIEGTLRRSLEESWGCPVYDTYGTHEVGTVGFDCRQQAGMHVMEDTVYLEIVDVDTGDVLPAGQPGNMVITVFFRNIPPIIRYNMRDLAKIQPESISEACGCGSRFRRMGQFLGRSDAMVKLRGVNVYPMACLAAIKSDERTTGEWVCIVDVVDGREEMSVHIEVRRDAPSWDGLTEKLERRLREDLGVAVRVTLTEHGSLAEMANTGGREGKARRLVDRRPTYSRPVH